jgi:O-acetyl-ADP-ribose deacetylase (regulator of RNase III)
LVRFARSCRDAANVAVRTVADWIKAHHSPMLIIFCCFDDANAVVCKNVLHALEAKQEEESASN